MIKKFTKGILVLVLLFSSSNVVNASYTTYFNPVDYLDQNPKSEITNQYSNYVNYTKNYSNTGLYGLGATSYNYGVIYYPKVISNPTISVNYYSKVVNPDTGVVIKNGDNVNVGDKINFYLKTFEDTDIVWNGTGYVADTPYGRWINTDRSPESNERCTPEDFFGYFGYSGYISNFFVHYPFLVIKPSYTIHHNGTAQLICTDNNFKCTVLSTGTIDSDITISETTGKMYFQWYYSEISRINSCYYTNLPVKIDLPSISSNVYNYNNYNNYYMLRDPSKSPTFVHTVPQQTINFNLAVGEPGPIIDPPTVSGPPQGFVGNPYSFDVNGTHPESKDIRFGLDFTNSTFSSINVYSPISGFAPSTETQSVNKTYSSPGFNYVSAITNDIDNVSSGPSSPHTIEIFNKPEVTLTADPSSVTDESSNSTLTWNSTGADSCVSDDFNTAGDTSGTVLVTLNSETTYTVSCTKTLSTGEEGTISENITIGYNSVPSRCEIISLNVEDTIPTTESALCKDGRLSGPIEGGNGWSWNCGIDSCSAVCPPDSVINSEGFCALNDFSGDIQILDWKLNPGVVSTQSDSCGASANIITTNFASTTCSVISDFRESIKTFQPDSGDYNYSIDADLYPRESYKISCSIDDSIQVESNYKKCYVNPTFKEF